MSYANFRKSNNNVEALKDKFNKLSGKTTSFNNLDDTFWTPKHVAGPEGTGEAIIRFLPAPPDGNGGQEPDDIVKYFQYSIRKNGKFYLNRGRNSMGRDVKDPVNEYNMTIWSNPNLTKDEKKKQVVDRQEYYIANIYIVKDPNKPENEGKVFRYQFGRQIYNKINAQLFPEFETDPSVIIFDPIEGADFILRVTQKTIPDSYTGEPRKVPTYENSKFANPSARWQIEDFDEVWKACHSLQSEVAEDKFKSYEDLKRQFDRVMGFESKDEVGESTPVRNTHQVKEQKVSERVVEEDPIDDEVPWINDDNEDEKSDEKKEESAEIDDWFSKL